MTALTKFLNKNKIMAAVLTTALLPLSFNNAEASPISIQNPIIAESSYQTVSNNKKETSSNELENFFEIKKIHDKLLTDASALGMENQRLENQIEEIIWLYDELHSISSSINGRVSTYKEIQILSDVATEWLREQKVKLLIGDDPENTIAYEVSYKSRSENQKSILDTEQSIMDYNSEREDLFKRSNSLLKITKEYIDTNVQLKNSMKTMLNQLDVIYETANAPEKDFNAAVAVKSIENFQEAIDKYIELKKTDFIVAKQDTIIRDDVGDLIRELDEVDVPSLSSAKP